MALVVILLLVMGCSSRSERLRGIKDTCECASDH